MLDKDIAHHFRGTTHYIQLGKTAQEYEILRNTLEGKKYTKAERDEIEPDRTKQSDMFPSKSTLENEINNIVFIPTWFHNYLHSNKVPRLRTRKDYYKMLKLVLLTENSYNEIKSLSLNNSSVSNALKSIQNLASNMPDQNKNELIEYLRIVYDEVQSKLLDDLLQ